MESGLRRWSIGQGSRNGKLAGGKRMYLIQTDDFEYPMGERTYK